MSEQEVPLGYFEGPEGDIICLIKAEEEEKYTLGKVIRFNPEQVIFSRLYHKNIREVEACYKAHFQELDPTRFRMHIETFENAFEEMIGYRYRPEKKK